MEWELEFQISSILYQVSTLTINLTTAKFLIDSILSTNKTKCVCVCADIEDFYLNTEMERYKYIELRVGTIPEEIME